MSCLEQLKKYSTIVVDFTDFETIKTYNPVDVTTNPTFIWKAATLPEHKSIIEGALRYGMQNGDTDKTIIPDAMDMLNCRFCCEILKIIPGRVSIAVDPRYAFDTVRSVENAIKLIKMFEELGANKNRILITIVATWEGIQAAKVLKAEHAIHCNMTLVFSFFQAIACAEANVTLISPNVGRILDWYVNHTGGVNIHRGHDDPGVVVVKRIFNYFKRFDYDTKIMAATLKSVDEVKSLAGCDLITMNSKLLNSMTKCYDEVSQKLNILVAEKLDIKPFAVDEQSFRFLLNEDTMASDELNQGIRSYCADTRSLENTLYTAWELIKTEDAQKKVCVDKTEKIEEKDRKSQIEEKVRQSKIEEKERNSKVEEKYRRSKNEEKLEKIEENVE